MVPIRVLLLLTLVGGVGLVFSLLHSAPERCEGAPPQPQCTRGTEYCIEGGVVSKHCVPSQSVPFVCPLGNVSYTCTDPEGLTYNSDADRLRILGWRQGDVNTTVPDFGGRSVRQSSLDPCELIPAYDEVWTDGICMEDLWAYRPFIDAILTLLGGQELFRFYLLEKGGPEQNYAKVECDLRSYTNQLDQEGESPYWMDHLNMAKQGEYTQIIDVGGYYCTSGETTYRWSHPNGEASGQCQLYDGVSYTIDGHDMVSVAGRYITTSEIEPGDDASRWFKSSTMYNVAHEMVHLKQNAHWGKRLYMENGNDGECCTLIMEHITYITYHDYIRRQPDRFRNFEVAPAWSNWKISDYERDNVTSEGLMPTALFPVFPTSIPDALEPKWFTATLLQRVFRFYLAYNATDGYFRNHALASFTCEENCEQIRDHPGIYDALVDKRYNPPVDEHDVDGDQGSYQPVFDSMYALKGIATLYFIAHSKNASGLDFAGFYTYELKHSRTEFGGDLNTTSDLEMAALAGFPSRTALMESMHEWIVRKLHEGDLLSAAEEISDTLEEARRSIAKLKAIHRVEDVGQPRCPSKDLPTDIDWVDTSASIGESGRRRLQETRVDHTKAIIHEIEQRKRERRRRRRRKA